MMNWDEFITYKVEPYQDVSYRSIAEVGYIVWRRGTGDNIELLHIRTDQKGQGYGRRLFDLFLLNLKSSPPYYSVFGFTRTSNEEAKLFYGALGFNLQPIEGLYKDGTAVMFWQSYKVLVEKNNGNHLRS